VESEVTPVLVSNPPAMDPEFQPEMFYVDGYGRIVEMQTRGGVRFVLAKDSREALGKSDKAVQRGRRDPFDKSQALGKGAPEEAPDEENEADIPRVEIKPGEEEKWMRRMEEKVAELGDLHGQGQSAEVRAPVYRDFIRMYRALRELANRQGKTELQAQLDVMRQEAERYYDGARQVYQEAAAVFGEVGMMAQARNCKQMEALVTRLEKFREDPALYASAYSTELETLISDSRKLLEKCRIQEILDQKPLTVTGTVDHQKQFPFSVQMRLGILGHGVALDRSTVLVHAETYALINGDVFQVGDIVREQDVRVERIDRFGVQVSYKGAVRDVPMR